MDLMCKEAADLLTVAESLAASQVPHSMTEPGTETRTTNDGGVQMATGAKHKVLTGVAVATSGDEERPFYKDCRCTIGEDHKATEIVISEFDPDEDDDDEEGEPLDVYQAADIWRSNGEDEDSTFGYSDEELRRAADEG